MKNKSRIKVIIMFFLGLTLMAAFELGLIWLFERTLFRGWGQSLFAFPMILVGAALVVWSVQTLFVIGLGTPAPMVATEQLVRAGPYRYSRNPMTLGAGLFYLGLAALAGSWIVSGLVLFIFISLLIFIYIHETKELVERFGVKYLQYKKEIPFLFPRIPH